MINEEILKEGMIVRLPSSGEAEVIFVTELRARIKYLSKTSKFFETANGEQVTFSSARESDISPYSQIEIISQKE